MDSSAMDHVVSMRWKMRPMRPHLEKVPIVDGVRRVKVSEEEKWRGAWVVHDGTVVMGMERRVGVGVETEGG